MPRTIELGLRSLWRACTMFSGAFADRLLQRCFVLRKPARALLHGEFEVTAALLDHAIERAAQYLMAQQRDDGSLRGFCLYPGASTSWITAHVCFVVESVPALDRLARRAAEYLAASGADDGGWGYNRRVAVDCDSTAQALMVLQRYAIPYPDFLLLKLAAAQAACGGFPTYPPSTPDAPLNGWQSAHADVAAMVVECLRRAGGHEARVARGEAWLVQACVDGVLPAYWWSDDAYALWLQARTGSLTITAAPALRALLDSPLGCPQLAMALTAAVSLGNFEPRAYAAVRRLLAAQLVDGSWPCGPCLRVTSPHYRDAGQAVSGMVVADRRRVFATAHAVAALQCARNYFAIDSHSKVCR